jgi:Rhodopirellula transposase DDE domain
VSAGDGVFDAVESEDPGRPATPEPGQQFRYINRQVVSFRKGGDPVLSVDTKKKEIVGPFKNGGRTWRPKGRPYRVNVHDFPSLVEGKAIPYGTYEIGEDRAVVNVGIIHDTAEFAVESIRRWWKLAGSKTVCLCTIRSARKSSS